MIAADNVTQGSSGVALIASSFFACIGVCVAAYYAYKGHAHSKATDRAVNQIGADQPRIYDLVVDTAVKVAVLDETNQAQHKEIYGLLRKEDT